MERNLYLVVVAGGSGTRMGTETPKQFLELMGKAILQRTIEKFISAYPEIKVITVLPEAHMQTWSNYCRVRNFSCPQILVKGGLTRFHSVRNALQRVPDGALVAIHDGVRPLISEQMIKSMFEKMSQVQALVPVLPSTDTLKPLQMQKDGSIERISPEELDRSQIFAAQTPQIFRSEEIRAAYENAFDPAFTDDASVAEKHNISVSWCLGERFNIKITTPEDLVLAEAVIINGLK